jgi:hypothetical protein
MDALELLEIKLRYILTMCEVLPNGELLEQRKLVANVNNLKIDIYPNEHPPPHFHIKSNEINASFSILNCELLKGNIPPKDLKKINAFYTLNKSLLIETWNNLRTDDCKVGIIKL